MSAKLRESKLSVMKRIEVIGIASCMVAALMAMVSAPVVGADVYICACSDEMRTSESIYGGIECQHGPEQDVDCFLFALLGNKPMGTACTDAGDAAPNPLPTWAQLTAAQQAALQAMGFNAGMVDGKCECFKCQIVNTQETSKCEGYIEYLSASCEKNKDGECKTEKKGGDNEVYRIEYAATLKAGKTQCSNSEGTTGDGSGSGTNIVKVCGGKLPGMPGGDKQGEGANCISKDCEKGAKTNESKGPAQKCKT